MKRMNVRTVLLALLVFSLTGTLGLFTMVSATTTTTLQNYTMDDEIAFVWYDADTAGGHQVFLSDDDAKKEPLGFTFTFYEQSFTHVWVCSNGYLSFHNPNWEYHNKDFPLTGEFWAPELYYYMIAPFWDDIWPSKLGGEVWVKYFSDDEVWVAEWKDVYHFLGSNKIGTFEVILYKSGNIIFSYEYIDHIEPPPPVGWYEGYTTGLNYGVDTDYYNSYEGITDQTAGLSLLFSSGLRATIDFDPDTLNRKSQGNWVTVYIEPPPGYNVEDIDIPTLMLNGVVPVEERPIDIDVINNILMVKFNRTLSIEAIGEGTVVITITGNLKDGTPFSGDTTIRALF